MPSLSVGTAASGSFVSRGAQFPQLMQDPPTETCRPCFSILEVPFVVQLFGFTLLLAERREGRRIAHLDEPNQPLLFLSWKVLGSGFVPGI